MNARTGKMKSMNEAADDVAGDAQEEFESAKKAVLDAYAAFLEAKKHLKRAALAAGVDFRETANERLEDAVSRARDKKDEWQENTDEYVKENPITSASIAFLGGVLFSRMFGR
jgi:ElaB/YqjD/DUF883 family membrane-anchored ribosome-binding protein